MNRLFMMMFGGATNTSLYSVDGITTTNNSVREGESFTLGNFGSLTGITGITISSKPCTSVSINTTNGTASAVSPSDGVRYGTLSAAVRLI